MIKNTYSKKINSIESKISDKNNKLKQIVYLRLLSFALLIGVIWYSVESHNSAYLLTLLVPIIFFAVLLKRNLKIKLERTILSNLLIINKNEVECLNGNYSNFINGSAFFSSFS